MQRPTTINTSDIPCTCLNMEVYNDHICPGCIAAQDRAAELLEPQAAAELRHTARTCSRIRL